MAYDNNGKGGIWLKKDKNGKTYGSCNLEIDGKKIYFAMFKNDKKSSEKAPDYNLVLSKPREDAPKDAPFSDKDIPF